MTKCGGRGGIMIVLFFLLMSGCSTGIQSETIVINDNEEIDQAPQDSSPVQVKNIYRLSDENADTGYWMGWTSTDSLVGAFRTAGSPESFLLKRLTHPYEQSENMTEIKINNTRMALSPDGNHVADIRMTRTVASLKLLSIKDGKETEIDTFNSKGQKYLQDMSWSDNSKYISYLILDAAEREKNSLRIYDTKSRVTKSYALNEFKEGETLLGVQVSNDGRSGLITLYDSNHSGKKTIVLGKLIDDHFEPKYKRQIGENQMTWIGNDQFSFLGSDSTLYEYDLRNGELSVILERVTVFEFSPDKKFIAYSLQDEDVVYVGKMQGRNVLYNEPVYHGIVPMNMKWNSENTSLFLQGPKIFANLKTIQNDSTEGPSFIIEFE